LRCSVERWPVFKLIGREIFFVADGARGSNDRDLNLATVGGCRPGWRGCRLNNYAAATLALDAISSARRRRRMGLAGEYNNIDRDDIGGGGGTGGEEALEHELPQGRFFCLFLMIIRVFPT